MFSKFTRKLPRSGTALEEGLELKNLHSIKLDLPKFPQKMEVKYWSQNGLLLQKHGPKKKGIGDCLAKIKEGYNINVSVTNSDYYSAFAKFVVSHNKKAVCIDGLFKELFSLLAAAKGSRDAGAGYVKHINELEGVARKFDGDLNASVDLAIEHHNARGSVGPATRGRNSKVIYWSPKRPPRHHETNPPRHHQTKKPPSFPKDLEVGDYWRSFVASPRMPSFESFLKGLKKAYKLSPYDAGAADEKIEASFKAFMESFNSNIKEVDIIIEDMLVAAVKSRKQDVKDDEEERGFEEKMEKYTGNISNIEKAASQFRADLTEYSKWAVDDYNRLLHSSKATFHGLQYPIKLERF